MSASERVFALRTQQRQSGIFSVATVFCVVCCVQPFWLLRMARCVRQHYRINRNQMEEKNFRSLVRTSYTLCHSNILICNNEFVAHCTEFRKHNCSKNMFDTRQGLPTIRLFRLMCIIMLETQYGHRGSNLITFKKRAKQKKKKKIAAMRNPFASHVLIWKSESEIRIYEYWILTATHRLTNNTSRRRKHTSNAYALRKHPMTKKKNKKNMGLMQTLKVQG